jgi:hypothetical protein
MIRRLLIPLLGSGLLLAATAGSTLAKCEGNPPPEFCSELLVDMNVGGVGGIFHAGTTEPVDINLWMGERPFDATSVTLQFTRLVDGTEVRADATATAEAGLWHADVLLSGGGRWEVMAQVVGLDQAEYEVGMETIQVPRAPDQPPVSAPGTPAAPTTPILPIALLAAGIAAAGLAGLVIRDRTRRRTAGASAPTGAAASVTADHA